MEETKTAKRTPQDAGSSEEESGVDLANDSPEPRKRGRGRPKGSKRLQVCVTDVNLMTLPVGISNGGSVQMPRGRGRPKGSTKKKEWEGQTPGLALTPRKRGRPKGSKNKSLSKARANKLEANLTNGDIQSPVRSRGRPKGSTNKRKAEISADEDYCCPVSPRKRGRPKGSLNKRRRVTEVEVSSEEESGADLCESNVNSVKKGRGRPRKMPLVSNGVVLTPHRGRGRPRKHKEEVEIVSEVEPVTDVTQTGKRGRGRPKGSLNKKRVHCKVGRPKRVTCTPTRIQMVLSVPKPRRGRPSKQPAKRGRPRKYPPPPPEELKKPKVWKPLGRPRKYPRVDPPEVVPVGPRRSRGRPRKSESRRGAHLRKISTPVSPSLSSGQSNETPRKRGRPKGTTKSEDGTTPKRGRPKGSVNKNKASNKTLFPSAQSLNAYTDEEEEEEQKMEMEEEDDAGEPTVVGGDLPKGAEAAVH